MRNTLAWGLVVYYLLTGFYLMIFPLGFYENAPGVSETGPYNMHFIRDVGFAFTVSALGVAYGLRQQLKPVVILGTAWLAMHGAFHLVLWVGRADKLGVAGLTDIFLVVLPAAVMSYLSLSYQTRSEART